MSLLLRLMPAAALVAALLPAAGCLAASATPQGPITLREQLNQTYANQQVSFPFTAKEGECVPGSVQVTGPKGAQPAQLVDIEYWPGGKGFVKSARLAFIVDELKPLGSATYTLAYGKSAVSPVAGDLKVDAKSDAVEITTSQGAGVRVPLGEGKSAVALKDAPGPIAGLRLGGAWAGGSKLVGDAQVASWSSKLTDNGPVVAKVVTTYNLADGNVVTLTTSVFNGDNTVRFDLSVKDDKPEQALTFTLPPLPGVKEVVSVQGYGQWMRSDRVAAIKGDGKPITFITVDSSIANGFPENSQSAKLVGDNKVEYRISSRNTAGWVDPVAPLTYGGFKTWNLEMIPKSWEHWNRKRLPLTYAADGTLAYSATFAKGSRFWSVGAGAHRVGDQLDRVKDMVLDWPADPKRPSPRLFVSKQDILDAWKRAETDPELMAMINRNTDAGGIARLMVKPADQRKPDEVANAIKPLRDFLQLLGNYDVMRRAIAVITMYDTVIDSDLITPQDKALFRAQAAYLGYQMADPQTWSMERGMHTGNPNMSVSYTISHGLIACSLQDHPMAKTWAQRSTAWMNHWLENEVGPNGEWLPEGSHYTIVSYEPFLAYAVASQRAGFADFTNDPRLKKFMAYHAKGLTPRDPQRKNIRVTGAWGRGTSGDNLGLEGFAARIVAKSDPALSRQLQWCWAEGNYSIHVGDSRFGGLEPYLVDRRLPAQAPAWTTDLFPNLGVFFRHAYGTPNESYMLLLSHDDSLRNLDIWTPEVGGISQWFARGKPVSTTFNNHVGYQERHELLRDGVRLARNWGDPADSKLPFGYYTTTKPGPVALLPNADYVRTQIDITKIDDRDWFPATAPLAFPKVTPAKEPKLNWTRQVLFLKDADPASPAYPVIRDTTTGGQPTQWQFRTLSEKIGTPDQAKDLTAFLADKPGQKLMPARDLPAGNRYTAVGQFDMDIEYFIASPATTPRHTLRYGGPDNSRVPEFEDLLLLQQPGDGAYYVALFPRGRAEAAPKFEALADGKVIKVAGDFGTDLVLLAADETTATADGVSFKGTAASVQTRKAATTVTTYATGEIKANGFTLTAPAAASLTIAADKATLALPADSEGGTLTLQLPSGWKVKDSDNAKTKTNDNTVNITASKGAASVLIVKK